MPPPALKLDVGLPLVLCGFASVYFLRSRQNTFGIYVPMVYQRLPLVKNECAVQLPNIEVKRDAPKAARPLLLRLVSHSCTTNFAYRWKSSAPAEIGTTTRPTRTLSMSGGPHKSSGT